MRVAGLTALALAALAILPLFVHSNYVLSIAISGFIFVVCAAALNLIYGFAGLLSFAQLGFWGIGGYAAAIAVVDGKLGFAASVMFAALLAAVIALVTGFPILRTNRHAFVIVTLTFALLCALVARDWISVTRGPLGIPSLPAPTFFGFAFASPTRFYYLAWAFAVLALGFLYALCTSRIGLLLIAIKQNEALARSQGISPMPYKLFAFVLGAAITGMAGGIYVFHLRIVDPTFPRFLLYADVSDFRDHWRRRQLLGRCHCQRAHGRIARGAALLRRLSHGHLRVRARRGDVRHATRNCRRAA